MASLLTVYIALSTFFILYMITRWSSAGINALIKMTLIIMGIIGVLLNLKLWGVPLGVL